MLIKLGCFYKGYCQISFKAHSKNKLDKGLLIPKMLNIFTINSSGKNI